MLVIHGLDLQRSGALPGFLGSLATLLLLLGALALVRRRELSAATANGLQAGFAALVLGNVSIHYWTARDPSVAAMFIFYCLGVGGVLYHRAALLGLLLLAYGSWLGATLIAVPHANALRDGLTIATSTGLGYVLYLARMRAILQARSLPAAILGVIVLALLVQVVEFLCTSGFPALFTRILTLRQLDTASYYGYLLLYNAAYMFDDVIVLAIGVTTLSHRRLQEKEGRWLKLLSGVVMVALGLYLAVWG